MWAQTIKMCLNSTEHKAPPLLARLKISSILAIFFVCSTSTSTSTSTKMCCCCCYLILILILIFFLTRTNSSRRRGVGAAAAAAAAAARILTTLPNRNPNTTTNRFLFRLASSPLSLRNPNNHFCSSIRGITTTTTSSSITQQKGISHHSQSSAACFSTTTRRRRRRRRRRVNSMMNLNGGDRILHFALSPSSVLKIQKGDITKWFVDGSSDAIVNAANERMLGGGGVDGAIHRAAGTQLRSACYNVQEVRPGVRCPKGDARITPAFRLPVSHIIHTVGPIYDDDHHPEVTLGSAYRNCLRLCKENNIQYVAFPAISCGVYGYPYDEAASVAISTVKEFGDDLKELHFVLFEDAVFDAWLEKANELL